MNNSAPLLSPILRSDVQGRLLADLMNNPERESSITDLAIRSGVAHPTILREVDRLVAGGYLLERRVGRSRLIRPNTAHALYTPLRQIVLHGFGPAAILPGLLSSVPFVERAFIYGSWAARYAGEPGADPNDVDVLVLGERVDGPLLYEAGRQATAAIGREVNISVTSRESWDGDVDGFVTTVKSRRLLELRLDS